MAESAEHSLHRILPSFLIPVGSQVVLRTSKILSSGKVRPRGSVGIVIQTPATNAEAYRIRFTDGDEIDVYSQDLGLRRREVEEELVRTDANVRPFIIYRCLVGSHAFGLATEGSDDDLRGIYLPPARWHWSLYSLPEQVEYSEANREEVYWELEKFLRLALKGNPNVLEVLWSPLVLHADEVGTRLRKMRHAFLSRYLYKTYSGYVLSQFRRMTNAFARTGQYRTKHAMHLIRMLHAAIATLRTGEVQLDASVHREELLAIKAGQWSFEDAKARALDLDQTFQEVALHSPLPERPDYGQVDAFLLWARRRMVDA